MIALRGLAKIQDWLSRAGFILAACILAFIAMAYSYEVVSRYFFNAPTIWASPLVSYALCLSIFLTLPDLARRGEHISIDLNEAWASPELLQKLNRFMRFLAGLSCLAAAWITAEQAWSEYIANVFTNTYLPIPKYWLFVFIPYGFLSGGIYFLRQAAGEKLDPTKEVAQ
jgi:TRAP-type C4-dicarboxylate transport system permease small subunit